MMSKTLLRLGLIFLLGFFIDKYEAICFLNFILFNFLLPLLVFIRLYPPYL